MRVSRLYVNQVLQTGQSIELDKERAHYLCTVLRLRQDAQVTLFNGRGGEYLCKLIDVNRKTVCAKIEKYIESEVESPLQIHLGLGVSRSERMDFAVQKAVELGVNEITPLITQRCNVAMKSDKAKNKLQHWQKIIQHACEQSGRNKLPSLIQIAEFEVWLKQPSGLKLLLDPYAQISLKELQPVSHSVTLLSGPEGGFSETERQMAKSAGFIPVRLGQRILRTETAVLAALAVVQMLWGDFH